MSNMHKHIEESQVTISELMLPSHANFGGKIHGGYILSLMDQIAFACASKHSKYYCVTASVDTVNFLKPIEVGELVTLKASINYVGKTSMIVGIRVEAENIHTGAKKHCNSSYFTMVAKDDNGIGMEVPGLILDSKIEIRRFLESALRLASKKKQKFQETNFEVEKHIHELKKHNVIIAYKGYN
ncbi:MAG: acyl-CoA thioesterase [Aequorivita sp.]|nr:acyl-CoA thioesterase [Aequorivita sp.]